MRREFLPPPSSPPKNETDAATRMSKGSTVILRTKHDLHYPPQRNRTFRPDAGDLELAYMSPLLRGCLRLTTCSAARRTRYPAPGDAMLAASRRRRNGVVIRFWRQVFAIPVLCCAALIYGEAPWVQTRVCEPKW